MTIYTHVQGGTGAGRKRAPIEPHNKVDWTCENPACKALCKFYWRNCPRCGHRRPA